MPEKLGDFLEQNIPVNEAWEQLMQLLADRTGLEILSSVSLEPTPQENPVIQAAKGKNVPESFLISLVWNIKTMLRFWLAA